MSELTDSDTEASKSARTRRRIMLAAAELLSTHGYAGVTGRAVADAAGVQSQAIYYYFRSVDDLVEEVVALGHQAAIDHVSQALADLPQDASAIDGIMAAVAAHLDVVLTLSAFASASIRNFAQFPADLQERQTKLRAAYGAIWRDLFARGARDGEFAPDVDEHAARMLVLGALNWTPEWWDESRGSIEDVVATAQLVVRRGLQR
jgi:AcrR family transcriptional regulator